MEKKMLTRYRLLMVLGILILAVLDYLTDFGYRLSRLILPMVCVGAGVLYRKSRPVFSWINFVAAGAADLLWVVLLFKSS